MQSLPVLLLAIGFLCFMAADKAESADWVQVLENEEGVFYADGETALKNTAPVKEARELSVLKNHTELHRYLEVVEYDCDGKKRRVVHTVTHNKNGEVSLRSTLNAAWEPVAQQQKATVFFNFICRK